MKKTIYILILVAIVAFISYFLYNRSYAYFHGISSREEELSKIDAGSFDEQEVRDVASQKIDIVNQDTKVIMEYYHYDTDEITKEEMEPYVEILGLDRLSLITYTNNYMNHVSDEDMQKGLYDFSVVSFSENQLILRKSYKNENAKNQYYLALKDYCVVVYLGDKETVYQVTDIDSRMLPNDIAIQLSDGMFLDTDYDLFNFLETYSS